MKTAQIQHLYLGQPKSYEKKSGVIFNSSYQKEEKHEPCEVNENGFIDDTQSDKENHGGVDKAVCVYSADYYNFFKEKHHLELPSCAFGENLTITGLNESDISIGDQFQCGDVLFEVSQPRQPCWKISSILKINKLTSLIVKEAKTGFYLRVLQSGTISPTDTLTLIERPYPKLTIEFINRCSYDAKNHQEEIKEILSCTKLSEAYRESIAKRYKGKEQGLEEWQQDQ